MKRIKNIICCSFLIFAALQGEEIFLHEGLLTSVKEVEPLLAIAKAPPQEIHEKSPEQPSGDVVWLTGYWTWSQKQNDFLWVPGFWRKPPPEKMWIKGEWKDFGSNWVWLKGFWSDKPLNEISFIENSPPDLVEDAIEKPANENLFWVPGYYAYEGNSFKWVKGYWEAFDANWVLIPAHYQWRPEGYFFLTSFWDWPIEERGTVYASLDTMRAIATSELVQKAFYSYPDYLSFFAHYHHFHPKALQDSPPWWSWQTWWTYNWSNQWALWWWYTHPGYVQPKWITVAISDNIMPPARELKVSMDSVHPPLIVTANGVVSNKKAAKEARKLDGSTSKTAFILPLSKLPLFQSAISPRIKSNFKALVPSGKTNAMLLSRTQFVQKSQEKKSSNSPIKPYLKKLKLKLSNYQDLAVDNSTTETQRQWEEEIRDRDKRRSRAWESRKAEFNARSADTIKNWDAGVMERNQERGSYAEETYRHQQESLRNQAFWQPQMDERTLERKQENEAFSEKRQQHYQEEQDYLKEQKERELMENPQLSYSRDDARRDAVRSDTRRYMQNRENIRRDNLRYQQNRDNVKRDTLHYTQHQEDLKDERLKQDVRSDEKKKEDEQFWEELRKLEKERGDLSVTEDEKWWINRDNLQRDTLQREELQEQNRKEDEKFWDDQEKQREESKKRAYDVQVDTRKFGFPLPQSKE